MHSNKEVIEDAQVIISLWLKDRGLTLSEEKTKIVHSTAGFDFLGFNCKHDDIPEKGYYAKNNQNKPGFKLLITPSQKSIKKQSDKIGGVLKQMKAAPFEAIISKLNPIIKGWTNYFKSAVASKTFKSLDSMVWEKLWLWAKRRHPMKSKKWIANKYFQTIKNRKWCFATKKGGELSGKLRWHTDTKIKRHIKVKAGRSFYDGDEIYWASRLSKGYGDITASKAKKLKEPDGKCVCCKATFKPGDKVDSSSTSIHPNAFQRLCV